MDFTILAFCHPYCLEGKCNMHLSEIWHSKKNDCRLSRTQVKSIEEIDEKLRILNQVKRYGNYNKLTAKLHPMAYWQGDTCHDVLLTEINDK